MHACLVYTRLPRTPTLASHTHACLAQHLQQLLDEIVVGMGGRESADRRRYRIISRRDIANGGNASGQPGAQAADSTAHTLLTRPAGGVQRLSMRGVDVQFGLPGGGGVPLDRSMAVR